MRIQDIIRSQLNLSDYVLRKKLGERISPNRMLARAKPTSLFGFTDENSLFVTNERSTSDPFEFYRRQLFNGMEFRYHWQNNEAIGVRKFAPLRLLCALYYALYIGFYFKIHMGKAFVSSYFVLRQLASVNLNRKLLTGKKFVFITNFYNNLPLIHIIKAHRPDIIIVEVEHGRITENHKGYDRDTILYSPDFLVVDSNKSVCFVNLDTQFVVSRCVRRSFSVRADSISRIVIILTKSRWKQELLKAFDLIEPPHAFIKPHPRISIADLTKYLADSGRENYDILLVNEFSFSDKIYSGNSTLGFELFDEGMDVEFFSDWGGS
jgi:hypothetical protein